MIACLLSTENSYQPLLFLSRFCNSSTSVHALLGMQALKPHLQQLELILVTALRVGTNSTTSQWFVLEQMRQHRLD
jgi:hypothetical protein